MQCPKAEAAERTEAAEEISRSRIVLIDAGFLLFALFEMTKPLEHSISRGFAVIKKLQSYLVVPEAEVLTPSFSLMASESLLRRMPPTEAALTPSAENLPFS